MTSNSPLLYHRPRMSASAAHTAAPSANLRRAERFAAPAARAPEYLPEYLDDRLDSWKEIAAFLNRTVRTAQRWEASEGLPVHRHVHRQGRTVFALKQEIRAWQTTRVTANQTPPPFAHGMASWLSQLCYCCD